MFTSSQYLAVWLLLLPECCLLGKVQVLVLTAEGRWVWCVRVPNRPPPPVVFNQDNLSQASPEAIFHVILHSVKLAVTLTPTLPMRVCLW